MRDTGNLRAQQVLLPLVQEGVRDDSTLKVAAEVELYLSGYGNIGWQQVWQSSPLVFAWAVADPVSELVNALTAWFLISWLLLFRCWRLSLTLSDVIVSLGTADLAPEAER